MGDISDYYRDYQMGYFEQPKKKSIRDQINSIDWVRDNGPIWVTGKFERIPVQNMSTSHIINTIRAWSGVGKSTPPEKWCGGKDVWIDLLTKELLRRNDNNRKSEQHNS